MGCSAQFCEEKTIEEKSKLGSSLVPCSGTAHLTSTEGLFLQPLGYPGLQPPPAFLHIVTSG